MLGLFGDAGLFQSARWVSTALDLAFAGGALFAVAAGRRRPELTVPRVGAAAALTALFILAKLVALIALGIVEPFFGSVHLLFLDATVVLPAAGAGVLAAVALRRRRVTRPIVALAVLACLAAPLGAYVSFVEPFSLRLERARVPLAIERAGDVPLRLGVISDLQTGRIGGHEREAVDRLMAQRPDVILLPGDVFQGPDASFARELPRLRELLGRLAAPGGVYLVGGDVDDPGELSGITAGTSVRVLEDEIVTVRVRDRRVTIGGVRLAYGAPSAQAVVRRLSAAAGRDDVRLLLAHRPDAAALPPAGPRVDLAVAGHTHGGQIALPIFGPPVIFSGVPRDVGAGGLHRVGGGPRLYVSRGVGVERGQAPRMRFLAPPEISVIALRDGA